VGERERERIRWTGHDVRYMEHKWAQQEEQNTVMRQEVEAI
jgi:hypothetical protein